MRITTSHRLWTWTASLLNRNASPAVGGALCIALSNVAITNSTFIQNTAEVGGALVAFQSNLTSEKSVIKHNKAGVGGDIVTSESIVNIHSSKFAANRLTYMEVFWCHIPLYSMFVTQFSTVMLLVQLVA